MCDDFNLETLTGSSTGLFQILADLDTLAADHAKYSRSDYADPKLLNDLDLRRHTLERQLYSYAPTKGSSHSSPQHPDASAESALTLNIRRLTGLLHLYSRIDHLEPDDACV